MKPFYFILILSIGLSQLQCQQKSSDSKPTELVYRIENYLEQCRKIGLSGSMLVAKGGTIIYKAGFGMADAEAGVPNTPATVFDIGSVTKQFTGAAILTLEQAGKLSVQNVLSDYFANVPQDKKQITLHHLLTHSSGLPDAIGNDEDLISKEDFIAKAFARPLEFEPGSAYQYSNVGFSLLAMIIERVSGKTYEQYLHQYLFIPAGMLTTGYILPDWSHQIVAVGYKGDHRWGLPSEKNWDQEGPGWHLKGNGGILSSVEDLYRWHQALEGNAILSEASKQKYYARHIEEGEGAGTYYGYGWAIFPTSQGSELITHNGGNGVFFCDFYRQLDSNDVVIYCNNKISKPFRMAGVEVIRTVLRPDYTPPVPQSGEEEMNFSDHPQSELLHRVITILQSGDDQQLEHLVQDYFSEEMIALAPMERHLEMLHSIGTVLTGHAPQRILDNGDELRIRFDSIPDFLMIAVEGGKIVGLGMDQD